MSDERAEIRREYLRFYRLACPERAKATADRFDRDHPGRRNELDKIRRRTNPDKFKRSDRKQYWKTPDRHREIARASYHKRGLKNKDYELRKRYGISLDAYQAMVDAQKGKCVICGILPESGLFVDHCHGSKCIRGLLCCKCNAGIGFFNDTPALLRNAAKYLDDRNKRT